MTTGELIKKAGLKATPQRKMVYEIMKELGHSSIDEVISRVQQQNPEITVSTVYRITDTFCEAGLLSKMKHSSEKAYYDITTEEHYHVFTDKGVIDYFDPALTEMIRNHLKGELFNDITIEKISINIIASSSRPSNEVSQQKNDFLVL